MMGPNNYIIFLCYGDKGIFYECAFSLLSLSRLHTAEELSKLQVWIYTDDPAWFGALNSTLNIHCREINQELIKAWRGQADFVHRVKAEALKDCMAGRNGNILYVDTDSVFTQKINKLWEDIEQGALYMHNFEGVVSSCSNATLTKLNEFLNKSLQILINNKPIQELGMWNAGVLGFNTKYRYITEEVLVFCDEVYPQYPKHIVEQFAFSIYFQQAGNIKTAAPYLVHYWNLKEARSVLASFFEYFKNKSWDELVHYSVLLQIPLLLQEKINYLHNRSIPDSVLKKQWQPEIPEWEELMKQV